VVAEAINQRWVHFERQALRFPLTVQVFLGEGILNSGVSIRGFDPETIVAWISF
jgi:hypothetical protein